MKILIIIIAVLSISLSANAQNSTKLKILQSLYIENGNTKLKDIDMEGTLYQNKDKSKCIVTIDANPKVRAEGTLIKSTVLDGLLTNIYDATDHRGSQILLSVAFNNKTNSIYIKFEYSDLLVNFLCKSSL